MTTRVHAGRWPRAMATAADVQRVARQYLDPDHFAIVVVGDKNQVQAGLAALHEGPIVERDMWGRSK